MPANETFDSSLFPLSCAVENVHDANPKSTHSEDFVVVRIAQGAEIGQFNPEWEAEAERIVASINALRFVPAADLPALADGRRITALLRLHEGHTTEELEASKGVLLAKFDVGDLVIPTYPGAYQHRGIVRARSVKYMVELLTGIQHLTESMLAEAEGGR